jgi:hypothetical protein
MKRSESRFGLKEPEWQEAKSQVRKAILEAAWDRRMTSYSEVAAAVSVIRLEPFSPIMNHLLGAIFEDERTADRPALTSIVTHMDGDKQPGPGFYEMARSLGYRFNEPFVFWSTQVQEVFKMHGRPERSRPSATGPS